MTKRNDKRKGYMSKEEYENFKQRKGMRNEMNKQVRMMQEAVSRDWVAAQKD